MLLDPLEEQFHLPPRLVDQCDSKCRQDEVVGEKLEALPRFHIEITRAPQRVRVRWVWISYWTLTVKPRGQAYEAGEGLERLQAPIDHLERGLVAVRCADPSPPSTVRRSAAYGFRRDSCRLPRRCH